MKIFLVGLVIFIAFHVADAKTQLILTTNLDEHSQPVDRLSEVTYNKDQQFVMYFSSDTALGVEKIYFEVSVFDPVTGTFGNTALYPVDIQASWANVYEGIFFEKPATYRIRVYSARGDLVTRDIEVVRKD
jgi:hypothetical protein